MGLLMLLAYQLFFPLVGAAILLRIAFSGRGAALREGRAELRQRLGLLSAAELAPLAGARALWFHAASVGEVQALKPILASLAQRTDRPRIVVTTTTVAGRDRARALEGVDCAALAPLDCYPAIRLFLARVRPASLILIETELWPMTLWAARRGGVRIGIANGRLTERAFARYLWLRPLLRPLLDGVERAALQTEADRERYLALGLRPAAAAAAGNVKYDARPPQEEAVRAALARLAPLGWGQAPCWVAASSRPGEEEILLDAHRLAAGRVPGLRLILAPRHLERCKEVEGLIREKGLRSVRWSQLLPFETAPDCVLVDAMGALSCLFSAGRAAFVGGTLVPIGGHNLLEPALSAVPVLFGPHTESIRVVAEVLLKTGGGRVVRDAASLAAALAEWAGDPEAGRKAGVQARAAAWRFAGATDRTVEQLRSLIFPGKLV